MKLLTAKQMRDLDHRAINDYAIPGIVLMENAGRGAADSIHRRYCSQCPGPVLIVSGKGNNGGDGYVIARHLENRGWAVTTLVLAERTQVTGDAAVNLDALLKSGATVLFAPTAASLAHQLETVSDTALIIDAIFGNGLNSAVRGHYRDAIDWINQQLVSVIAIDLPSGIDATTGQILGAAVDADFTLTFAFAKLGQVSYPAQRYVGDLEVVDLGMPRILLESVCDQFCLVDGRVAAQLLPARPEDGHKGTFGHLLVVAGSEGKSGAARMCAEAALRCGCGLVSVASPCSAQRQIANGTPEVMTLVVPDVDGSLCRDSFSKISSLWDQMAVVAVGPGLGTHPETQALVREIVQHCPCPLVLDADALNAIAHTPELLRERKGQTILTPHPGEMARLTGLSIEYIQNNRLEVARQFADDFHVNLLLKGARTVLADTTGRVWVNSSGNNGMASAGMGDVLTGMVAACVAQQQDVFSALALAAYLHGAAADLCLKKIGSVGYLATDVTSALPAARQHLKEGHYA